jgi:hypothetical protein
MGYGLKRRGTRNQKNSKVDSSPLFPISTWEKKEREEEEKKGITNKYLFLTTHFQPTSALLCSFNAGNFLF